MTGTPGAEVAYVRIKSYQWKKEQGLNIQKQFQGIQTNPADDFNLEDLVQDTMGTIDDYEGQFSGAQSQFAPLLLNDTRLLQNNAQSMELFRQFSQSVGIVFDFFVYLYVFLYLSIYTYIYVYLYIYIYIYIYIFVDNSSSMFLILLQ